MCLLIVMAQVHPGLPLVVGANRDEWLDRPAVPMAVLRDANPRVLGGRDELAGGTWLAVNDAGVVAGLTNRPTLDGPDRSKRSRGELPLAFASFPSAADALATLVDELRPSEFNPSWLLVGDRRDVFFVDMSGDGQPAVEPLPPGVHILENRALGAASVKADHVRGLLDGATRLSAPALVARLQAVLADHFVPPTDEPPRTTPDGEEVPPEVRAACVHTERYGTRWSAVITVPADTAHRPNVMYCDGPACHGAYRAAGWTTGEGEQARSEGFEPPTF